PDVDGKPARHLPTVPNEPTKLPFTVRHLVQLHGLLDGSGQPEQVGRIGVQIIRGVASCAGRIAAECDASARTAADFRLPLVHLVSNQVEAPTNFVRSVHFRGVGSVGERALVVEVRLPAGGCTPGCEPLAKARHTGVTAAASQTGTSGLHAL